MRQAVAGLTSPIRASKPCSPRQLCTCLPIIETGESLSKFLWGKENNSGLVILNITYFWFFYK